MHNKPAGCGASEAYALGLDGEEEECHCLALAYKRYGTLGGMFLTPKDLENMRINGLIILTANTRQGIIH